MLKLIIAYNKENKNYIPDLNTSHVKVNHSYLLLIHFSPLHLNTSHVKVNRIKQ